MFSKPFLVAALAVACVTAAGAGAYIAVRQNHDVEPASAANQSADTTNPAKPANPAVPETEAVIPPPLAMPLEQPRPMAQSPAPRETVQAESRTARTRNAGSAGSSVRPSEASTAARPTAAGASSPAGATSGPIAPAEPSTAGRAEATTAASLPPESARYEPPPAPPAPVFDELVVPSSAVMGLQIQTALSSEHARIEDRVEARVTRDISVDGKTAIPAGTRAVGSVTLVEKGGKVKERARLGVQVSYAGSRRRDGATDPDRNGDEGRGITDGRQQPQDRWRGCRWCDPRRNHRR